jgi:hypothetical protein
MHTSRLVPAYSAEVDRVMGRQPLWIRPKIMIAALVVIIVFVGWSFLNSTPTPVVDLRFPTNELVKLEIGGKEYLASDLTKEEKKKILARYDFGRWYGPNEKVVKRN